MKKIILLFAVIVVIISCDLNDDNRNFSFEAIPISTATLPEFFELGETYEILLTYFRPTTCHFFEGFDFVRGENNLRTVAIINSVLEDDTCEEFIDEQIEVSFDFFVVNEGVYTFRFWQGIDENGDPVYLILEVPVVISENNG
ncbi:hypothetical protein [Leptobacterium sp. I13]|uniref:hypothetical protein n=1 Tax=Leptobacterium meishanense TaxID=3128904 RepID=UPI0030ED3F21